MLIHFHSSLTTCRPPPPSIIQNKQQHKWNATTSRRMLMLIGFSSSFVCPRLLADSDHVAAAAAAPTVIDPPQLFRTRTLPSGVRFQDIIEGEGAVAEEGDTVEINYVCRRSNGYFVHSTVDQLSGETMPVTLALDETQIIKGLKDVLVGMRVGGKRRALIPPSVGYVNENLEPIPDQFGPRRSLLSHVGEPLIFEVQLLKLVVL